MIQLFNLKSSFYHLIASIGWSYITVRRSTFNQNSSQRNFTHNLKVFFRFQRRSTHTDVKTQLEQFFKVRFITCERVNHSTRKLMSVFLYDSQEVTLRPSCLEIHRQTEFFSQVKMLFKDHKLDLLLLSSESVVIKSTGSNCNNFLLHSSVSNNKGFHFLEVVVDNLQFVYLERLFTWHF